MKLLVALALTVLAMAAAGCGDEEGRPDSASDTAVREPVNPPFRARVAITKDGYRPQHVRILVGGSVTFVNLDKDRFHTAETEDLPEGPSDDNEFDTHTLTWEEPYTVTFHKPETIEYHSSFDPEMKGTVEAVAKQ